MRVIIVGIYIILLLTHFSCSQKSKVDDNNAVINTVNLSSDTQRWQDIPRPILVDSASFWTNEDDYQKTNYHINAFSVVDTADILFYKSWSDSLLDLFNAGSNSFVFFFRDKENTPEILIATSVGDERYDKYCFLLIQYSRERNYEYFWDPYVK